MAAEAILYPSIAMFFLTLGVMLSLGLARYRAIHAREVSIAFFRSYDEGGQPARLHLLSRHVQNHFEIPPLFHLGALATYAAGQVTTLAVAFAWCFVAARCVHTAIHLGPNDVSVRFFTFGASLLFLAALWLHLLFRLLSGSP